MNAWECWIKCDVRGCMNMVGGRIRADSNRLAEQYAQKDAIAAGWDIDMQDGTHNHRCPEHRRGP